MYALDNSSGVSVMPAIADQLSTGLFFTEGGDGQEPSYPGADWYNIVQSELIAVLTEAGISPNKTALNQLSTAIKKIIQKQSVSFATDTGAANAYVVSLTPALASPRGEGMVIRFKVANTNTGACTVNDGVSTVPIVGLALSALQGGEMVAGGYAWIQWHPSVGTGSYVLLYSTGAPLQVANGTKSQHAVALGQFVSTLAVNGAVKFPDGTMLVKGQISSTVTTTANSIPVTFPVAFGVACDCVAGAFTAGIDSGWLSHTCELQTTTGFTLRARSGGIPGTITFCYIAIGRWK